MDESKEVAPSLTVRPLSDLAWPCTGCAPGGRAGAAGAGDARPGGAAWRRQGQARSAWPARTPPVRQPPRVQGRAAPQHAQHAGACARSCLTCRALAACRHARTRTEAQSQARVSGKGGVR